MVRHRMSESERRWVEENYAKGTIHDTLAAFEAMFGWHPTARSMYVLAHRLGLRKELQDPRIRNDRAQTRIRWSCEPEMEAWMLEHDMGSFQDVIEAFEQRFGIRLSRGQVNQFRASHGTQKRVMPAQRKGGRPRKPIGFERRTKGGILVKVAEEPTVPMSKDNWRYKHHIAYEEAYGPIPDGCQVWAVDGDNANCDPENLVAVPNKATGAINALTRDGITWHDRESMISVVRMAQLKVGINDAEHKAKRECAVCGKAFRESEDRRRYGKRVATCPECLALGRKAKGDRKATKGPSVKICKVCGREFAPETSRQVRCRSCIEEQPRLSADKHRRKK